MHLSTGSRSGRGIRETHLYTLKRKKQRCDPVHALGCKCAPEFSPLVPVAGAGGPGPPPNHFLPLVPEWTRPRQLEAELFNREIPHLNVITEQLGSQSRLMPSTAHTGQRPKCMRSLFPSLSLSFITEKHVNSYK